MDNQIQSNTSPLQLELQTHISSLPTTNSRKIILFGMLGFFMIGGGVFAGIQIGKNQTHNQQLLAAQPTTSPSQTEVNPTVQPTTNPTTDPTANWKVFIQKDILPISFKYPANLVVSVRAGERPVIVIDTKQSIIPEMFDSPIAPIEIMHDLNRNIYSKAVEKAKSAFDTSSLKVDILNNNDITGSLITGNVIPGMRSGRFVEVYFDNGTNPAIVFWYEGYSETYKNTVISEEVFTQIVKTVSLVK